MPFPLTTPPTSDIYNQVKNLAIAAQTNCLGIQIACNGAGASTNLLSVALSCTSRLSAMLADLAANPAAVTALTGYVQMQAANPSLNVVTSIQTSANALATLVAAQIREYPKSSDGTLADRTMDAAGNTNPVVVAGTAMPQTTTAIAGWLATLS